MRGPGRSEIHMLSNVHFLITWSWYRPRHLNLEVIKVLVCWVTFSLATTCGMVSASCLFPQGGMLCPAPSCTVKQDSDFQGSAVWPPTNEKVCPTRCCSASVRKGVPTSTTAWITQMRAVEAKAQRPTSAVCSHLAHVLQFNAEARPRRPHIQSL